jgi:site-specific DNA recombinase
VARAISAIAGVLRFFAAPMVRRMPRKVAGAATATAESIGRRERCSIRKVNMTISLAFLAPDLVKAAIDGRLPHRMGSRVCASCQPNGRGSAGCSDLVP